MLFKQNLLILKNIFNNSRRKLKENYIKFYSQSLNKETEMLVFGDTGKPVILFPTSMGRFYQNKDFKLIDTVVDKLDNGKIKIYCPDSIDEESWYNKQIHPAERVKNHLKYDDFIIKELVPKILAETSEQKVVFAGCSFGAYHATNFGYKYPHLVSHIINMGGAFDIKMHLQGYYDDNVYFNNPPDFLPNLNTPDIYNIDIVFGIGENDFCLDDNIIMSEILKNKNINHWLDIRRDKDHDWPVWREMFPEYINKIIG